MGRRGPKSRGPYESKTTVLSTRIRPDTREDLEAAARRRGWPLSQEIEHRLRTSFVSEETHAAAFGSEQNYSVMRLIASVIESLDPGESTADWTNDPAIFELARTSIMAVLDVIKPAGETVTLISSELTALTKISAAIQVIDVARADPLAPLADKRQILYSRLRTELKRILERPETLERAHAVAAQFEGTFSKDSGATIDLTAVPAVSQPAKSPRKARKK